MHKKLIRSLISVLVASILFSNLILCENPINKKNIKVTIESYNGSVNGGEAIAKATPQDVAFQWYLKGEPINDTKSLYRGTKTAQLTWYDLSYFNDLKNGFDLYCKISKNGETAKSISVQVNQKH